MHMIQTKRIDFEDLKELPIDKTPVIWIKQKYQSIWRVTILGGQKYYLALDKDVQKVLETYKDCFLITN